MNRRRRNRRTRKHQHSRRSMVGGLLVTDLETNLVNTHVCNVKPGVVKDSPGMELFDAISNPFPLNTHTIAFLQHMYQSDDHKWFKFVAFNNDGDDHVYIIDGAKINKHSVCMVLGLLDVTKPKGEYAQLREAVEQLLFFKSEHGANVELLTPEQQTERTRLIQAVDALIERDIRCMPVIAAGSGSVLSGGQVCINNKSGHYKPTEQSMALARSIIEANTGGTQITVKSKEDKAALKARFGEHYESYSGICL